MGIVRIYKKFTSILSRHQKLRIIELVVLMIIGGLLEMCSVSLILPFMNVVMSPDEAMEKWYVKVICDFLHIDNTRMFLVFIAILLSIIYIIKNGYLLFEYNVQYRFVYGNMLAMQNRVLSSYLDKPYEFFLSVQSGEIIRVINNDIPSTFNLLISLLSLFTELVVSGMLVITIFCITPFITICIAAVLVVLTLVVNRLLKNRLHNASKMGQIAYAGMNKWLLQAIQGIKEVKVMESEAFFKDNFDKHGKVLINSTRKNQVYGSFPRFLIEAFSMGAIFLLIAFLIYQGSDLESIVPILSAVAMAAIRLLPAANRVSYGLTTIAYNEPMLDKLIHNLDDIKSDTKPSFMQENTNSIIKTIQRKLLFDKITFKYPTAETNVLEAASMTINRGESIGLVGTSGAGKTTAIDILLGLLIPQEGKILIDGVDISSDISGWHRQIGYIPQSIFMLDDTIRNNVTFGEKGENISDKDVWRSLDEASLGDFVRSLPDGLDTEIGERGMRLSGGQRQRIGIARALYRNPDILIFDEATSALDNETELEIMESITKLQGQKTMIIIAHRLTTIEKCDHIYRIENGKILFVR